MTYLQTMQIKITIKIKKNKNHKTKTAKTQNIADAPMLPDDEEFAYDIQKELEVNLMSYLVQKMYKTKPKSK